MDQESDSENLGIKPEEMLTDEARDASRGGELVPEEKAVSYQEMRELEFREKIAISLEKLSGYEDSQLLAVYPEYGFHGGAIATESGGPLEVLTVAEIREKIVNMRDPQRNFSGAKPGIGAGPEGIIVVYDDLPPSTQTQDAKARWRDFYSRTRSKLGELFTADDNRKHIQQLKFEALNELRGLRGDRRIAIRSIDRYDLHIFTVDRLRQLILDMESPENELTHGHPFGFFIEEYDHPDDYVKRDRAETALEDIRRREFMLAELSSYADDELLTWVYPNETRNPWTGDDVVMQDTAGELRRRIREADHREMDWFSHAGGIKVIATGEISMSGVRQHIEENKQAFQRLVSQAVDTVNRELRKDRKPKPKRVHGPASTKRLMDDSEID